MTFCPSCGMRSHEGAVHLCTAEVVMALGARGAKVPGDAEAA